MDNHWNRVKKGCVEADELLNISDLLSTSSIVSWLSCPIDDGSSDSGFDNRTRV